MKIGGLESLDFTQMVFIKKKNVKFKPGGGSGAMLGQIVNFDQIPNIFVISKCTEY